MRPEQIYLSPKKCFEIKCKIVQSSDAALKYDNTAAADVTKKDAP